MRNYRVVVSTSIAALALAGCAPTFNQSLRYNPKVADAGGTIAVSDPKVFRREFLLNERADDIAWINQLIEDSRTKVVFRPELAREVEQITALAAGLGLRFDPAAGLNYRRARETGDVQQEIDLLRLQLQLEQLRSDAALLRAAMPGLTEPVNADLGKLGDGKVAPATNSVTASAVSQLQGSIDKLLTALTTRLDAEGKPVALAQTTVSPFDEFRDRAAYRDMLKSARNAARLDELHDQGTARLFRLNFQATVIPAEKYPDSLGAVQMKVSNAAGERPDASMLNRWLH